MPTTPSDEPPRVRTGHVRTAGWRPVARGVHITEGPDPTTSTNDELRAWLAVLPPGACLTGLTAAAARGWPTLPMPDAVPVFAAAKETTLHPRRPGLVLARHTRPSPYDVLDGLRVAQPSEILLSCARWLGVLDLVVLADHALHSGDLTRERLEEAAQQVRRGVPRLRRAAELADGRAESVWETLLRMLHVACEVPVEPQAPLLVGGVPAHRADLLIVGTTTYQEYDGTYHLERTQYAEDRRRERRLLREGYHRNGYTAGDVLSRADGVLRDADHALGRAHDPRRTAAWNELLRASLFTAAGQAAVGARWAAASAGRPSRAVRS